MGHLLHGVTGPRYTHSHSDIIMEPKEIGFPCNLRLYGNIIGRLTCDAFLHEMNRRILDHIQL